MRPQVDMQKARRFACGQFLFVPDQENDLHRVGGSSVYDKGYRSEARYSLSENRVTCLADESAACLFAVMRGADR
jgi:hypothetical protein